jgi:hypothetical protein
MHFFVRVKNPKHQGAEVLAEAVVKSEIPNARKSEKDWRNGTSHSGLWNFFGFSSSRGFGLMEMATFATGL